VWNLSISWRRSDGTTSQGTTAPSITPWLTASGTCGTGIPTGAAPSARSASPFSATGSAA
jgi:hypothetical protein